MADGENNTRMGNWTKEQKQAYNEFIDYMAKLYQEYGHILNETTEQDKVTESVD